MEQFTRVEGVAAPLLRDNIDTDLLIPSREMTSPGKEGYGEKLLASWRYLPTTNGTRLENPEFVLNRAPFRQARFLLAGSNFGSGSSREQAAWALRVASPSSRFLRAPFSTTTWPLTMVHFVRWPAPQKSKEATGSPAEPA